MYCNLLCRRAYVNRILINRLQLRAFCVYLQTTLEGIWPHEFQYKIFMTRPLDSRALIIWWSWPLAIVSSGPKSWFLRTKCWHIMGPGKASGHGITEAHRCFRGSCWTYQHSCSFAYERILFHVLQFIPYFLSAQCGHLVDIKFDVNYSGLPRPLFLLLEMQVTAFNVDKSVLIHTLQSFIIFSVLNQHLTYDSFNLYKTHNNPTF